MLDHHLIIQTCPATTTTIMAQVGTLLETRISSSLMYETTKLVPTPKQCSFQL